MSRSTTCDENPRLLHLRLTISTRLSVGLSTLKAGVAPEEQTLAGWTPDGEEELRRKTIPVTRGTMVVLAILGKRKLRQLSLFESSPDT